MKTRVVVYISGFLSPPNWISYPSDSVPDDVEVINVNPSSVGSLHDRACQVFFELVGGTVDYGEEHSQFHNHNRYGVHFAVGKHPKWNADNPIQIIGHSFGGLTAWVLQNYLAQKRFSGYDTSELWISSMVLVNAPFNGVIQAYEKGLHHHLNPLVTLWSPGYPCGLYTNVLEYLDIDLLRRYTDVGQSHWLLSHKLPGSLLKLVHCLFGYGIHCSTDNISYDSSIRSRLSWSSELITFDSTYYCSIVGKKNYHSGGLLNMLYCYVLGAAFGNSSSSNHPVNDPYYQARNDKHHHESHWIDGVNVSCYSRYGNDLLMGVFTQEYPRMNELLCGSCYSGISSGGGGRTDGFGVRHSSGIKPESIIVQKKQHHSSPPAVIGADLASGCWHYFHRDMSHLTVSFQDRDTWQCIWSTSKILHEQYCKRLQKEPGGAGCEPLKKSRSDMQRVCFTINDRHTVLLPWSTLDRLTTFLAALLLLGFTFCLVFCVLQTGTLLSAPVVFISVAVYVEVYLLIFETFSADCRSKVCGNISSDWVEALFSLLRLSAMMMSASERGSASLMSGLYLLEYYILMVSSYYSSALPQYNPDRWMRRSGVQQYTATGSRLCLGLLSLGRWTHLIPHICLSVIILTSKVAWCIVTLWDDVSNLKKTRFTNQTVYCSLMSLWLVFIVSSVAALRQIIVNQWFSPDVKVVYVCLIVLGRLTIEKMKDMSESFQYAFIKGINH